MLALGVMGCGETTGTGGSGGDGGQGGVGGGTVACVDNVCPCTEVGIRAAVAEGGGPFTFSCDGPTTVVTEAEIVIDNDVILDGEGNLTVDGNESHRLFSVPEGVTAELRGFALVNGRGVENAGRLTMTLCTVSGHTRGGIHNRGTMTLRKCSVSENSAQMSDAGGITNGGTLTMANCTVSGNDAWGGGGIFNYGTMTVTNCTVSGNDAINRGGAIVNSGTMTIISSTVAENTTEEEADVINGDEGTLTIRNSLIDGDCGVFPPGAPEVISAGYNIESPGDTCGFDQEGDQVDVSADDLKLGELADNGGPTMTHALLPGSVAIDVIPADMCEVDEDQRGFPRDSMCDVGSFEVQPAP
jgi:hypothetical protein